MKMIVSEKLRHIFFKFVLGLEVATFVQTKNGNAMLLDKEGYVYKKMEKVNKAT